MNNSLITCLLEDPSMEEASYTKMKMPLKHKKNRVFYPKILMIKGV